MYWYIIKAEGKEFNSDCVPEMLVNENIEEFDIFNDDGRLFYVYRSNEEDYLEDAVDFIWENGTIDDKYCSYDEFKNDYIKKNSKHYDTDITIDLEYAFDSERPLDRTTFFVIVNGKDIGKFKFVDYETIVDGTSLYDHIKFLIDVDGSFNIPNDVLNKAVEDASTRLQEQFFFISDEGLFATDCNDKTFVL